MCSMLLQCLGDVDKCRTMAAFDLTESKLIYVKVDSCHCLVCSAIVD